MLDAGGSILKKEQFFKSICTINDTSSIKMNTVISPVTIPTSFLGRKDRGQSPARIYYYAYYMRHITKRNISFLLFSIILFIVFYAPMKELITLSFHNELYSHIVLIPFVSGYFIFIEREKIFSDIRYSLVQLELF